MIYNTFVKLNRPATNTVIKWSWIVWGIAAFLCTGLLVCLLLFASKNDFSFTNIGSYFAFIWLGFFILGCGAFAIASFLMLWSDLPKNIFIKVLLLPVFGLIYPFYLFSKIIKPKKIIANIKQQKIGIFRPSKLKAIKFGEFLAVLLIILPIWVTVYIGAWTIAKDSLGYSPTSLPVVGTGSMYPTWPKGTDGKSPKELSKEIVASANFLPYPNGLFIFGKNLFGHEIGRGDIVTFTSERTKELSEKIYGEPGGFLKRVVAIGGDTIELRGGIFYLNGEPQKEPYIARSRSTYGGNFLPECKIETVPEGMFFAMGDNRKGSGDSRQELGFVSINSIDRVISWDSQKGTLDKNWHDATNDLEESAKIHMDKNKYVELLNLERKKVNSPALKYQTKLEGSAKLRGEKILEFDDLSWEATRSGYPMWKAMRDAKYSNIVYGEAPSLGWYDAEELVENQFTSADSKKFLLNKEFQEVGIAEVEVTVNGCPKQITVVHFAGYVPPNYKQEDINSWKISLDRLKEIQPNWEKTKEWPNYSSRKADTDRITQIIAIRISRMTSIYTTMNSNKWLSNEQKKWIEEDPALYTEQEALATKLNSN